MHVLAKIHGDSTNYSCCVQLVQVKKSRPTTDLTTVIKLMASAATVQPTYPLRGQTNRLTLHMAIQLPMSIVLNTGEANVYECARSLILQRLSTSMNKVR